MGKLGFEAAINKAEEKANNSSGVRYDYFKVEAEPKQIRFITVDGMNKSILNYTEHYVQFKNGWSRSYSCPDADNEGESKCKLCRIRAGNEVLKNDYALKFVMQVVERDAPVLDSERKPTGETADKVKVFKFSAFFMQSLKPIVEKLGDIGDRDYKISLIDNPDKTSKIKKVYVIEPATKKATPTDDETDTLMETRAKLTDIEPVYDEKDIDNMLSKQPKRDLEAGKAETKKNLQSFLEDDDDEEEVSTPTKEKITSLTTTESEEDDEDDTDNDFFAALKAKKNK